MAKPAPNARDAAIWLPVADLRPNPRNPRLHGSEVAQLARTILRTAWGAPIVAQARGRRIIGGHGRLEAAKLILQGLEVDGEMRGGAEHSFGGPPGCVPVRVVDVSDAEADAMTLADNARGLQGTDSAEAIVAMAAQFGRDAAVMADIGFGGAALDALVKSAGDALLGGAGGSNDGDIERHDVIGDDARERIEIEEDEAPVDRAEELRAKWNTAAGQLWEIPSATVAGGVHRILCGDSTKAEDVARVMAGERCDLLATDPPYGINANRMTLGIGKREFARGDGWDASRPDLVPLLALVDKAIVWGGNYFADQLPVSNDWLCWHKKNDGRSFSEFELAWTNLGQNCRLLSHHWSGEEKSHPTQKPLPVVAWSLQIVDSRRVLDPFLGSGTTAVAAERTGRLCSGLEREPVYVAVALERLSALGLTPRLIA